MMFAGDACKARVGPKPALFHHFCYEKYCDTILKTPVADDEECTYCMDCKHPKTKVPGSDAIRVSDDLTVEQPLGAVEAVLPAVLPAKRGRAGARRK